MKQIEIDSHIGNWFNKRDELTAARSALSRAESHFEAATRQCATALLPPGAGKEERWIFPTTDGRAVVAYMKEKISYAAPSEADSIGGEHRTLEPALDEHKFK